MTEVDRRYQAALEARLADLGLNRSVTWTGFREDVPRIMAACDVIVHASIQPEPLGVVIMEGLAARKPVICTSGGGTEEMVTQNETGLVVPPGNPGALAEAVNKLLSDPPLRVLIGNKGREVVEARFTHDHRVQAFLEVFREIVGASRG
jgi:glycosyltransferase involved in cell wall biosynthesis